MAQAVNVNFKLDADVKKSMEQACSELGLSMSAAFTIFAKKVGREKRIPLEVQAFQCLQRNFAGYL
jgi:DNA-damage-inducible protein J